MSANSGGARASWSGKWAFILAAAASAIGLGNLWRFPYLAAKYGGGVFLITYVVLVVTFGFTLMMLEAALGRKTGQSALGAFKSFGKKYAFIGIFTSAIPFFYRALLLHHRWLGTQVRWCVPYRWLCGAC